MIVTIGADPLASNNAACGIPCQMCGRARNIGHGGIHGIRSGRCKCLSRLYEHSQTCRACFGSTVKRAQISGSLGQVRGSRRDHKPFWIAG